MLNLLVSSTDLAFALDLQPLLEARRFSPLAYELHTLSRRLISSEETAICNSPNTGH